VNHFLRMCCSRQRTWWAQVALIAATLMAGSAIAAEPVINGVVANLSAPAPYLIITGTNVGTTRPTVTLGSYPALSVTSFAATTVTATLPSAIVPGSYLLTLTKAGGKDEFWVTIGAAGPPGPKGDPGPPRPGWVSLGRMNALTRLPNVEACEQRFLNHGETPPTMFMPAAKTKWTNANNEMRWRFSMDLLTLYSFVGQATMQVVLDDFNDAPDPKGFYAEISMGAFTSITGGVTWLDENAQPQGAGMTVNAAYHSLYEMQESCP